MQAVLEVQKDACIAGQKVVIVDDLLATGGKVRLLMCVSHTAHVIAIGWTSVRPSVRQMLVLCRNGSSYHQTVFTAW